MCRFWYCMTHCIYKHAQVWVLRQVCDNLCCLLDAIWWLGATLAVWLQRKTKELLFVWLSWLCLGGLCRSHLFLALRVLILAQPVYRTAKGRHGGLWLWSGCSPAGWETDKPALFLLVLVWVWVNILVPLGCIPGLLHHYITPLHYPLLTP